MSLQVASADGLSRKQRNFARALLKDKKISPTQAVIDAGYNVKSRHVARQIARENLHKPAISTYLSKYNYEADETIVQMMGLRDDDNVAKKRLAFDAAVEVKDRVEGKPTQRTEQISTAVNINIDLTGDVTGVDEAGDTKIDNRGSQPV